MSLILDALRKMEQERRSKRGNGQDLRPEVLRYRLAAQPKGDSRYPLAIAAGIVLLLAGLGTGFMLKGRGAAQVAEDVPVPAAHPAVAVESPVPTVPMPAAPATVATPQPVPVSATAAAVPAQPVAGAATPVSLPAEPRKTSRIAATASAPAAVPQPSVPREENAAAAGGQDIVISGIAYQDERRMRRAVLNGSLVGEGAEVAGARVVEIKETKVKLSRGGHVFEVPFSSGLQSR